MAATIRRSRCTDGRPAQRTDDTVLEHAQQLGLRGERHVTDLIQEQRAPAGRGKEAVPPAIGARERAFLVAEELGLEQALGHRRAVHRQEPPPAPGARPVDRLRDELLAGAALPQQQHRGVALGHRADLAHGLLHDPRAPQDAVQPLLPLDLRAQPLVLATQPMVVERAPHGHGDLGQLEGLRQVVIRALTHGLDRGFQRAERGHQDDARRGPAPPGGGEHLEPADLIHHQIGDDHVEFLGGERIQRGLAAGRGDDGHVFALEMARQHGGHVRIVVDDQDPPTAHTSASYSGSQTVKVAPCPGRLCATMVPP